MWRGDAVDPPRSRLRFAAIVTIGALVFLASGCVLADGGDDFAGAETDDDGDDGDDGGGADGDGGGDGGGGDGDCGGGGGGDDDWRLPPTGPDIPQFDEREVYVVFRPLIPLPASSCSSLGH